MTAFPDRGYERPVGHCPAMGKGQYVTRKAAKRHAARQNIRGLRTFLCQHCGYIHVGHQDGHDRAWHRDHHKEA